MGVASTDKEMEMVYLKNQSLGEAEIAVQHSRKRNRRRSCILCGSCCCLTLVVVLVTVVVLALTVFKPKNPVIDVQSVTLDSFDGSFQLTTLSIKLNLTLGLVVAVTNPNKVSFRYTNSTAYLMYRGNQVGLLPIPPGEVGPGGTGVISSTVDVLADRIISNPNIIPDFISGSLHFSANTDISGRVSVLGIIHHHVRALATCDVTVLTSGSISETVCRYDIKL